MSIVKQKTLHNFLTKSFSKGSTSYRLSVAQETRFWDLLMVLFSLSSSSFVIGSFLVAETFASGQKFVSNFEFILLQVFDSSGVRVAFLAFV